MATLENADQWWAEWERIKDEVKSWGPPEMDISVILASKVAKARLSKKFWKILEENSEGKLWELIDKLTTERNDIVYTFAHSVWEDAPDNIDVLRGYPEWYALCDLCSEGPSCLWPDAANTEEEDEPNVP